MSKRMLKSDDVEGFMLAVWDEWIDTQKLYDVEVTIDVRAGDRRGSIGFHAYACARPSDGAISLIAVADAQWPSHKYTSLHACLLNLLSRLNIEVQRWYREVEGTYYSSPRD